MKKYYIIIFIVLISTAILPINIYAANSVSTATAAKISDLKTRGTAEVDRRISTLNLVVAKIDSLKRLSDDQKGQYKSEINQNISDLSGLKTKIGTDAELTTLKLDVKSVVSSYRIFAIYIPKIHLLAALDIAETATENLSTFADKLDTLISLAKKNGKDTTTLQTELADMQNKIADASAKLESTAKNVNAVSPSGYPSDLQVLKDSRDALTVIRADIVSARDDAKTIISELKK